MNWVSTLLPSHIDSSLSSLLSLFLSEFLSIFDWRTRSGVWRLQLEIASSFQCLCGASLHRTKNYCVCLPAWGTEHTNVNVFPCLRCEIGVTNVAPGFRIIRVHSVTSFHSKDLYRKWKLTQKWPRNKRGRPCRIFLFTPFLNQLDTNRDLSLQPGGRPIDAISGSILWTEYLENSK